jgi:hypothetical protein
MRSGLQIRRGVVEFANQRGERFRHRHVVATESDRDALVADRDLTPRRGGDAVDRLPEQQHQAGGDPGRHPQCVVGEDAAYGVDPLPVGEDRAVAAVVPRDIEWTDQAVVSGLVEERVDPAVRARPGCQPAVEVLLAGVGE